MTLSGNQNAVTIAMRKNSLERDIIARFKVLATQRRDLDLCECHERIVRELAAANRDNLKDRESDDAAA